MKINLDESELIALLKARVESLAALHYMRDTGMLRQIGDIEVVLFELRRIAIDTMEKRSAENK